MIVRVNMSFASYFPSLVRHGSLKELGCFETTRSLLGMHILEFEWMIIRKLGLESQIHFSLIRLAISNYINIVMGFGEEMYRALTLFLLIFRLKKHRTTLKEIITGKKILQL